MRALVTGATGFIGGALVRALLERGYAVTALVRSPDRASVLKEQGVTLVPGDVTEPSTLDGPMRKAQQVFHLAAWYEIGAADRMKMYQINVRGTQHVIAAAHRSGVERVVHCSSVAALGSRPMGDIGSEDMVHHGRFGSNYEETKWRAHQHAMEEAGKGAPVVVVMPGAVYGPGDPSVLGRLLRVYARGWLVACPGMDTGFSWVHVDDVADGIAAAAQKGRTGQAYILGGENASVREVFDVLAPITGIRAPRFEMPSWLMRAGAPLSPLIGKAMGAGPRIVQEGLANMSGSWMAFSTKAEHELGYAFRGISDGMAETVAWLREN